MKTALLFLFACTLSFSQITRSGGGRPKACVGSPGDTVGAIRDLCATSAGALYVCKQAGGCTLAAHWQAQGGASTPGGSSGQVQYNDGSGGLGADDGFAYNSGTKSVGIKGTIVTGQAGTTNGKVTFNGATSGSASIEVAADGSSVSFDKAASFTNGITVAGGITETADGVHAGISSVVGNTTVPAIPANSFGFIGPNSASFTSYVLQPPATAPSASAVVRVGATSSGVSAMTFDTAVPTVVASGTAALGTASISANSCASVVTVAASGVASTDVITFTPNASIKAVTGYTPAGTLTIVAYPTTNNVNFDVCNKDQSNAVTPGAVTLNWRVVR
jgi:hypothetical protein